MYCKYPILYKVGFFFVQCIEISDIEFNQYKKSSDAWVEMNLIKHNVRSSGVNIFNKFLN